MSAAITTTEGAAGTTIVGIEVENRGDRACAIGGPPGVALLGADELVLARSTAPIGGGPQIELRPGATARIEVGIQNWCGDPALPAAVGLTLPDGTRLVALPASGRPFPELGCPGPGQPATITVGPDSWTPVK